MTPVFCCGFECGVVAINHFSSVGTASVSTTTVRSGSRSGRVNPSAASGHFATAVGGADSIPAANIWVIRSYVYFNSLPTSSCPIIRTNTGTGPGAYFKSSDSKIYAGHTPATPVFGASGVTVTTGQWYLIDVKVNSTNNPWTIDVQVNGSACGQLTNAIASATQDGMSVGVNGATTTCDIYYDDVVVSQTSADYPIGAGFVNHFIPTSDGTHNVAGANDFEFSATGTDITNATTTAYTLIDDVPLKSGSITEYINLIAPPNATDYVEVVFGPASGISTPSVAPRAVETIIAKAKGTGTGTNNLRIALNDNGTTNDIFNGDTTTASPTASYARKHYATGPAGAWTVSAGAGNFNNIRMRCFTSDAAPDPWWASAMIEAEFAPLAAPTDIDLDPMGMMGFFGL